MKKCRKNAQRFLCIKKEFIESGLKLFKLQITVEQSSEKLYNEINKKQPNSKR